MRKRLPKLRVLSYVALAAHTWIWLRYQGDNREALLLGIPFLVLVIETISQRRYAIILKEERASKRKILSNSISGILHRVSQPIFALKMAWEQINEIRAMKGGMDGEEYDQYLKKLAMIFGDSISRLNKEIIDCRKNMATKVIKPRKIDFAEVMEVMAFVKDECHALGVKFHYQTKKESESGKSNASALKAVTYGDLEQLQEVVYNTCLYCAKYALINETKMMQVTTVLNQDTIVVKVGCPQPFISKTDFDKLTAGTPHLESEFGLGNAVRVVNNFGGSLEFSNGFLLVFPRK